MLNNQINYDQLTNKWKSILEHQDESKLDNDWKKKVTAVMLENQQTYNREKNILTEAPTNSMGASSSTPGTGNVDIYDPVLISMVRRTAPKLIAFDVMGVQPMNMPTGLVFAMRSHYDSQTDAEALFNEANTGFSAENAGNTFNFGDQQAGDTPDFNLDSNSDYYNVVGGMSTTQYESLGANTSSDVQFNEMAFSIEQITVTAKARALKAEWSLPLQQDLRAVHGMEAENVLSNMLQEEITAEINREMIRNIYITATVGAQHNVATAGRFNLDVDANGRWSVEKFQGLLFQISREANQIAFATRRGKGNLLIASADLVEALAMTGRLKVDPAIASLNVDPSGSTFAGTIGNMRVYVDPYIANDSNYQIACVGYKGSTFADAGLFYCPYIPLVMSRAVDQNSFSPKISFMSRYGLVANPFATSSANGTVSYANKNSYYRRFTVTNIL